MNQMAPARFRFGNCSLDLSSRTLRCGGELVDLRPKSFDVLQYLVGQAGKVVTKDEIMRAAWPDVVVTDESLTRCISDIRKALDDSAQTMIKTVPRRGYIFAAPVSSGVLSRDDAAAAPPRDRAQPVSVRGTQFFGWRYSKAIVAAVVLLLVIAGGLARYFAAPAGTPAERPSIAVLPFAVSEPGREILGDGIAEDISGQLSKFGELMVIAHQSAKRYRQPTASLSAIGRELDTGYLLTGSVRIDGQKMRIAVQLVNAATDRQIWSDSFDREFSGLLELQDQVAQRIVTTLVAHVVKSEHERVLRTPPSDVASYEYVLRANALTSGRPDNLSRIAEAEALFEKALQNDPRYARAIQGLAYTRFLKWAVETSPHHRDPRVLDSALALAQTAVELDGSRADAHAMLGWILNFQGRLHEGIARFEEAFQLNPSYVDGRYGMLLSHVGRAPDAIAYMRLAMRVDPFYPPTYTGWLGKGHYFNGDNSEALVLIRSGAERMPDFLPPRVLLAAVSARVGSQEETRAAAADVLRLRPGFTIADWVLFLGIVDRGYAEQLATDLRKAGLPD